MEIKYTSTPSPDYINQLAFDYIETYSFQRGKEYEDEIRRLRDEYGSLQAKYKILSSEEELHLERIKSLTVYTQYLVDINGNLHFSATKTNSFAKGSNKAEELIQILKTNIKELLRFMCAPYYRDAVIFYDKNATLVSALNICLSCEYMETEPFHHIDADYETYDSLKRWFLSIGHEVEDPDRFITDELNKLKEKNKVYLPNKV